MEKRERNKGDRVGVCMGVCERIVERDRKRMQLSDRMGRLISFDLC